MKIGLLKNLYGSAIARVFISRMAGIGIGKFLDSFGCDRIPGCIHQGILISDLLPADYKDRLKTQAIPYLDLVNKFSNDDAYNWIPQKHKTIIESCLGGKDWAIRQIQTIREFILL
jgi:hypothetical protein